jgi:hypothetical protein
MSSYKSALVLNPKSKAYKSNLLSMIDFVDAGFDDVFFESLCNSASVDVVELVELRESVL